MSCIPRGQGSSTNREKGEGEGEGALQVYTYLREGESYCSTVIPSLQQQIFHCKLVPETQSSRYHMTGGWWRHKRVRKRKREGERGRERGRGRGREREGERERDSQHSFADDIIRVNILKKKKNKAPQTHTRTHTHLSGDCCIPQQYCLGRTGGGTQPELSRASGTHLR